MNHFDRKLWILLMFNIKVTVLMKISKSIWFDINPLVTVDYLSQRSKGWSESKGWPSIWRCGSWLLSPFKDSRTRRDPENAVFRFCFFWKPHVSIAIVSQGKLCNSSSRDSGMALPKSNAWPYYHSCSSGPLGI